MGGTTTIFASYLQQICNIDEHVHDIHTDSAMSDDLISILLQRSVSKVAILDENDEGTMHDLHKIAVGAPWGTEGKTARQNE